MKQRIAGRIAAFLTAVTAAAMTASAFPARAENFLFISEVKLAAGEGAADSLEEAGYRVMAVGLNDSVPAEKQVYLGYKLNTGSPITNLLIAPDSGDMLTQNGVTYTCADHVDVDAGIGSAGCVYYTKDERAGAPLVGLNILKADVTEGEELLAIPNDGAEVVRRPDGAPADLELHSDTALMYLAQIHDSIVCPYISEVVPVCDTDRWNAIYTAAQFGYNYFAEGDIDDSPDTCTILAYKRTANAEDALTAITAVAAETVDALEADKENPALTGNAVSISGVEYVRTSAKAIDSAQPYYLYSTKDSAAGNPIFMIYANTPDEVSETLFGTWISGYFGVKGVSNAYSFAINEDAMQEFQFDRTVCVRLPVQILQTAEPVKEPAMTTTTRPKQQTTVTEAETDASETEQDTITAEAEQDTTTAETETTDEAGQETTTTETETTDEAEQETTTTETETTAEAEQDTTIAETETTAETEPETTASETAQNTTTAGTEKQPAADAAQQTVSVSYLTFRDGLPESLSVLNGLRDSAQRTPILDHTQRGERDSKYQASAFSKGWYILILGAAAIIIAIISAIIILKRAEKPQPVQAAAVQKPTAKPEQPKAKTEQPKAAPEKKKPVQNASKPKSGKKMHGKKKK